jgi:hypothetical protein
MFADRGYEAVTLREIAKRSATPTPDLSAFAGQMAHSCRVEQRDDRADGSELHTRAQPDRGCSTAARLR